MAVYTEVSDDDLRAFLGLYEIGDLVSYKGIAEGVENSNFLLLTSEGPFILTLYEKRVDQNDLPFFLGLMEHLSRNGVTCPLPVHQKTGAMIGTLAGRPAAIVTFLNGAWPRKPNVEQCFSVGSALAGMHLGARGFSGTRRNSLGRDAWAPLWDKCQSGHGEAIITDQRALMDDVLLRLDGEWPHGLEQGTIHADLFPDNVFFMGDTVSGLIDFYFACTDALAYDLAICLNAWCFERDHAFNVTKGRALLDGYQSVRPLPDDERAALPMLALGAATRFMLTRLYDWVNTPDGAQVVKKDPLEYVRRMHFHRAVSSASDYGLA